MQHKTQAVSINVSCSYFKSITWYRPTALHCTALHCTALHCTAGVQCCPVNYMASLDWTSFGLPMLYVLQCLCRVVCSEFNWSAVQCTMQFTELQWSLLCSVLKCTVQRTAVHSSMCSALQCTVQCVAQCSALCSPIWYKLWPCQCSEFPWRKPLQSFVVLHYTALPYSAVKWSVLQCITALNTEYCSAVHYSTPQWVLLCSVV